MPIGLTRRQRAMVSASALAPQSGRGGHDFSLVDDLVVFTEQGPIADAHHRVCEQRGQVTTLLAFSI